MEVYKIRNKETGQFWSGRFWSAHGKAYSRNIKTAITNMSTRDREISEVVVYKEAFTESPEDFFL